MVFNTGAKYARKLGLTSVLQDNSEAGVYLANELTQRGYRTPLIVQLSRFPDSSLERRYNGISEVLGTRPALLNITNYNNTRDSVDQVINILKSHPEYDSILSLGGAVSFFVSFFLFLLLPNSIPTLLILYL